VTDSAEPARQEAPTQPDGPQPPKPPDGAAGSTCWYQSSGRPRALRWLADDFTASFAALASSLLRSDVGVRLTAAVEDSRSHFAQTLEELTCSYVLAAQPPGADPAGADVCLEFSPVIALGMIERLLGGSAVGSASSGRPLTAAERRVLHRLAEAAAVSLSSAWPSAPRPQFRAELKPIPSPAAGADEPVLVIVFELTLHGHVGAMRLCAAGGILDGLMGAGLGHRPDAAPLELSAALEGITVDDAELAELAQGDLVATDIPVDGEVIVRVGGIPKFAARLGTAGGRKLLTITRRLDGSAGTS